MIVSRLARTALAVAMASSVLVAPAAATQGAAPTGTRPSATTADQPLFRNTCNVAKATLPASVEGAPASFGPGAATGLYVWHTQKGWRVRLTHNIARTDPAKPVLIEVRGRITATRPITGVRTIRLEDKQAGEWISVHRPKRKVMEFRFVNGGFVDGINFRAGCSGRLTFTVWQITRDATTGKVTGRTPLPVFVGGVPTQLTSDGTTTPALDATRTDVSAFTVLRTPVTPPTS